MGALATLLNWLTPVLHPLTEFRNNVTKLNTIHQDSIQTFSMLASGLVAPQTGPEAFTGELSDAFWAEMQTYLNAESALTGASVSVAEGGVIGEAIAVCEECAMEVTGAAEVAAGEIAGDVVLDEITGIVDVAAVAEAGANPIADVAAIILTIVAGAALLATLIKLAWDIYNAVQQWQRMMHNIGDTPLPKLPPNPTPVPGPTPSLPPINSQQLTPQQQQEVNDIITQLSKEGFFYSQSDIEALVKLGYDRQSILAILRSGSVSVIKYTKTTLVASAMLKDILRALELAQRVVDDASRGKVRRAKNYHGRLPNDLEHQILSNPDAVFVSTGKSARFIFLKGSNIVVTEGTGSNRGSIVTSYGPDGPRGTSGAASLGGSPNDPGLPVTQDMIIKGTIPTPGGDTIPPAIPIFP